MSQSVITTAFEQLKAEQAANGGILTLDEFVFANVPDLNVTDPIDRSESWPLDEQIVHRQDVSKTGTVNGNAVVYSVVLGAETGDFDFNWIGLINKASNTVAMIVHAPVQKKIKTASGQQGNVLTRSFMMEYNGASQITQITTPADTWQIDFTARLAGMDERIRKENIDTYGAASFYHDGFLVSHEDAGYSVKKGVGYIAGLRAELMLDKEISVVALPTKVWVDVCWKGLLTSVWAVETKITVADELANYNEAGEQHYVFAIADINADGSITDLRNIPALASLSGLNVKADTLPFFDDEKKAQLTDITEFARKLLAREDAKDILYDLGLGDGGGLLLNVKTYTASGIYTKTPGTRHIRVRVWGAGGGGGNTATSGQAAGGGCGGGYAEGYLDASEITSLPVTVGAGGSSVDAKITSPGGTGGSSSFGEIVSATGGTGSTAASMGGVGSGGNIINFSANPSQGTLTQGIAGLGGASFSSSTAAPHTTIKGDDGSFPGGGGAGGNNLYASGKGASGYVVVEEYS